MNTSGWLQLAFFSIVLLALTRPMGLYLVQVLDVNGKTWLDPALKPVERLVCRAAGIDPAQEQDWKGYAVSLLIFSLVTMLLTYFILRLQYFLPLNPQGLSGVAGDLSFNTAASFTTNTDWQNYAGESTLSYLSQMVGLAFHNFISAAAGIAVAAALVRGIARDKAATVGNFWCDLTRICLYLLLPICLVFAVFLVSQGIIQNFSAYQSARVVEPYTAQVPKKDASGNVVHDAKGKPVIKEIKVETQTIPQGPVASQVAIKLLGTNGGGFFNANAAHPFENPTPLSNFFQMLAIFVIPAGLTYYLGRMVKNQKHGWSVWAAMFFLFLVGVLICWEAESHGNPRLAALGVDQSMGNMEGKEVRFGAFNSALFATITTAASCGAVNSMLDSFTPLGGLVPMFNIQLGEVVFGGAGAGLYGMLVFVVLAIFLAGLMVGRTPEYLGKKIESFDIQVAALAILVPIVFLLGFTALAAATPWGVKALGNAGPHGFSEILYAFTSCFGNNGSAFAGLAGNTFWYNLTLGLMVLIGRFLVIVPVLALAGSLAAKKTVPVSAGSFPVSGVTFALLLVGTILIVGALTFFPAISLGPIVEHFLMVNSNKLF
jgi:K+-transporting ATPase ATPase A chain|uniref:Potassium-transporting ATPase potassium-binding subunit n=1 Tax=Desulfobacca acetoxidans TaxID=60893 RepID=A0A7V6A1V6_9BACT